MPYFNAVENRNEDRLGNFGLFEEGAAPSALIEQAIHHQKRFTGGEAACGKQAIGWKTIAQAEGQKLRFTNHVKVGKATSSHRSVVTRTCQDSQTKGAA